MTIIIENRYIDRVGTYEAIDLDSVNFKSCGADAIISANQMHTFRNISVKNCFAENCTANTARFIQCSVSNGEGNAISFMGCLFNEVMVTGKYGQVQMELPLTTGGGWSPGAAASYIDYLREEYRHVQWALDIQHADILDADLRAVPPRLVRRNRDLSAILSRRRWTDFTRKGGKLSHPVLGSFFSGMIDDDEILLVGSLRDRSSRRWIAALNEWKQVGIAE